MKIQIVDDNDVLIAIKESKELDKGDIYRIGALWVKNSKGEILLARRAYSKRLDPGRWGPAAAGTLEPDETYDSNIMKEAEGEIGLDLSEQNFEKLHKTLRKGEQNYFCQWFRVVVDWESDKFKVDKNEVHEIKWFTKEEALKELRDKPDEFLHNMEERIQGF